MPHPGPRAGSPDKLALGPTGLQALSPEARLLFQCARLEVDQFSAEAIRQLSKEVTDWQFFKQLVENHKLMPLVNRQLKDFVDETIVLDLTNQWTAASGQIAIYNVLLANELVRLLEQFRIHGIPIIPYKG